MPGNPGAARPAARPGSNPPAPAPAPRNGAGRIDCRLSRAQRLTRTSHFNEAYAQGTRFVGRCMVLWLRAGEGAALRLGVVAGRKVGPAVDRARAKRLLREIYRRNRHRFSGQFDVVLVARRDILSTRFGDLEAELAALAGRAGLRAKPE